MYTEKELKEATQIVYLNCLSDAYENLKADGRKRAFTIRELIRSSFNVKLALEEALKNGIPEKQITTKILAQYSDLKESDKSIIEEFSEDMLEWKVIDVNDLNYENGFFACCIETSEKDAIIAFRGSENMKKYTNAVNDWARADFGLLNSRSTRQQEEAEKYCDYIIHKGLLEKYNSLAVTGHSLGGNLATHFTISSATEDRESIFNKINQSINFDGPGVSDEYLNEHGEKIEKAAPKLTHYKWSAVGTLLFDIPGEHSEYLGINEELHKNNPKDRIKYKLITRHDTKSLVFDENGKAERGEQDFLSKGLSALSKTVDKFIPESVTTEIFAAADWIFERILRIKEGRNIEFNDISWAERFAKKGSIIGNCINFVNKTVDLFKEGALALGNEISEIFAPKKYCALTPKLAIADISNAIENDCHYNISGMNNAMQFLKLEKNIDFDKEI